MNIGHVVKVVAGVALGTSVITPIALTAKGSGTPPPSQLDSNRGQTSLSSNSSAQRGSSQASRVDQEVCWVVTKDSLDNYLLACQPNSKTKNINFYFWDSKENNRPSSPIVSFTYKHGAKTLVLRHKDGKDSTLLGVKSTEDLSWGIWMNKDFQNNKCMVAREHWRGYDYLNCQSMRIMDAPKITKFDLPRTSK